MFQHDKVLIVIEQVYFQAFGLHDMNIATLEGFRIGQKMSYHLSFC